jgi:hypothetical protein
MTFPQSGSLSKLDHPWKGVSYSCEGPSSDRGRHGHFAARCLKIRYRLSATTGRGCEAEVEAFVAGGAPEGGEVEGAEDVLFDDAAGTLTIEFVAAAVDAVAGESSGSGKD